MHYDDVAEHSTTDAVTLLKHKMTLNTTVSVKYTFYDYWRINCVQYINLYIVLVC